MSTPRNIVWIGLTIVSLSVLFASIRVSASMRDLQARIGDLEFAEQTGSFALPQLGDDLIAVKTDIAVIRTDIGWTLSLAPLLGWLPQVGGDVAQSQSLFGMVDALVSSVDALYHGWSGQLVDGPAGSDLPITEKLAAHLAGSTKDFGSADAYLQQAIIQRQQVQVERLSPRTAGVVQRLDKALPLLKLAIDGSRALPTLLGESGPRSYLIVAQNEDEIRATGGFVTAAGLLTIDHGKIVSFGFMDSYQVDDLNADFSQPPMPLKDYMLAGYWLFRDANWSPDFPTSARELASLYELGQHKKIDGVISLDQEMVRLVVQALQPVEVGGQTVTGDNLMTFMRDSWAPPPDVGVSDAWLARKNFIGNLASAIQARLQGGAQVNAGALGHSIYEALTGKHLLVYLPSTPVAASLSALGWDGSIRPTAGDYVFVVDSNIGFNKANALIAEQLNYAVTLAADLSVSARLTLNYKHQGTADPTACSQRVPTFGPSATYDQLMDLCYWDYLRIYVPHSAALIDSTRLPIPASEMLNKLGSDGQTEILANDVGRDVYATLLRVKRGDQQELHFKYQLPAAVVQPLAANRWHYTLTWQKQAGTPAIASEFGLNLPPGFRVISATASDGLTLEAVGGGLQLHTNFKLDADKTFDVVIQRN